MKRPIILAALAIGAVFGQQQPGHNSPSPLDAVPAPLVGALMDLYANYQANRPQLPATPQSAAYQQQRRQDRNAKVATGVAVGAAIGAMVAQPTDRGKAAAIGAVAGGLASLLIDQLQAKHYEDQVRYGGSQGRRKYQRTGHPDEDSQFPAPQPPPHPAN